MACAPEPQTTGGSGGTANGQSGSPAAQVPATQTTPSSTASSNPSSTPAIGVLSEIPATPLPTVEAETFSESGDIADDSAIYANPVEPALSVVIADNKSDTAGGVGVFDMKGHLLQFRQDGKIGNIDLRSGFPLRGKSIVLVGANNRTDNTLIFWQLDPSTQKLSAPIGQAIPTVSPNYGFCLYHSAASGKFYAFVSQETGKSVMEQYELEESSGKITGTMVRSFEVGSITEGCVADDELGRLYVGQEDVGLWRYGAEPSAGSTRTSVGAVNDGHLVADVEGVCLAKGPGTSGYLVVSNQGNSTFAVYDRETNAFKRKFSVDASGSIDAVSDTDGLDISTASLGPGFEKGTLVVHDGSNTGSQTSNLKFIPLR